MNDSIKQDLVRFRKRFQTALENFTLDRLEHASVRTRDAKKLMRTVAKLALSPGKRMRPYLAYKTSSCFGIPENISDDAGIALELFHDFALVHDDIMDRSDERRGKPTIHKLYESEHHKKRWKGSAEHYGLSSAILAGDLLVTWSDIALDHIACSETAKEKLYAAWGKLKEEVILGQTLDVTISSLPYGVSRKQLMDVLALKSGRYSIGRPMLMGYALADYKISERIVLDATEPLGLAFQIQDDIISTFGNPKKTGKSIDADLKEGKITLLAWEAVRRLPTTQSKIVWERTFGNPKATKKELDELRKIIRSTGSLEYVETLADQLTDRAIERAGKLPMCGDWFKELAEMLRGRRK